MVFTGVLAALLGLTVLGAVIGCLALYGKATGAEPVIEQAKGNLRAFPAFALFWVAFFVVAGFMGYLLLGFAEHMAAIHH